MNHYIYIPENKEEFSQLMRDFENSSLTGTQKPKTFQWDQYRSSERSPNNSVIVRDFFASFIQLP